MPKVKSSFATQSTVQRHPSPQDPGGAGNGSNPSDWAMQLLAQVPEGIVVFDALGKMVFCNQRLETVFGYTKGELEAKGWDALISPQCLSFPAAVPRHPSPRGAERPRSDEGCLTRKDGATRWIQIVSTPVLLGHDRYTLWIVRDTTEEKERNFTTMDQERMAVVGQIATGIAHEVNTPLSVLLVMLQLLLSDPQVNERTRQQLRRMAEEADRITRLMNTLLVFAQRETEASSGLRTINQLIDDTLLLIGPALNHQGIRIVKQFDPSVPTMQIAVARVEHALMHLLREAQQTMLHGGTITISTGHVNGSSSLDLEMNPVALNLEAAPSRPSWTLIQQMVGSLGGQAAFQWHRPDAMTFAIELPSRQDLGGSNAHTSDHPNHLAEDGHRPS